DVGAATPNRFGAPPDRNGARCAGGDDAGAGALAPEPSPDDVHRSAWKMVPEIRAASPAKAFGDPGAIEVLVAEQIGRACAQEHAYPRPIDGTLEPVEHIEHAGISQRL